MIKRSFFKSKYLPYLLILPQMVVTLTFFYWPAIQGLSQSFFLSDPFGRQSQFVWFYNYIGLFTDPLYLKSIFTTFFSALLLHLYPYPWDFLLPPWQTGRFAPKH